MAFTAAQKAAILADLNNDPRQYGFVALRGNDAGTVEALMRPRDGAAGNVPGTPAAAGGQNSGIITVKRLDISKDEFMEAVDATDLKAVNNLQQEYFQILLSSSRVQLLNAADGTDTRRWKNLKLGINDTAGTQTRLLALATRVGSRLEELSFAGATITDAEVAAFYGRG